MGGKGNSIRIDYTTEGGGGGGGVLCNVTDYDIQPVQLTYSIGNCTRNCMRSSCIGCVCIVRAV